MKRSVMVFAMVCCLLLSGLFDARAKGPGLDELNREAQNPVADLISLPLQSNTAFNMGPNNRTQNILNIQPVIPFHLGGGWNLVTRTIIPVGYQPDFATTDDGTWGLGDINTTLFLGPAEPEKVMWGLGPVFQLPTASDDELGTDKWSAGISGVAVMQPGNWTLGILANNIWSFAGSSDRGDVNQFLCQYFVVYNLPRQWYLVSSPIITANWEAESDDQWTVPVGGGVGKLFMIGKLPVNIQIQGYYNVEKPDWGADWSLRCQVQFLFPKF